MSKRETAPLRIGGSFITHFVRIVGSLEEARKGVPSLTRAQYDAIRAGKAWIEGDTVEGLEYKEGEDA